MIFKRKSWKKRYEEDINNIKVRLRRLECPHKYTELVETHTSPIFLTQTRIDRKCKSCGKVLEDYVPHHKYHEDRAKYHEESAEFHKIRAEEYKTMEQS